MTKNGTNINIWGYDHQIAAKADRLDEQQQSHFEADPSRAWSKVNEHLESIDSLFRSFHRSASPGLDPLLFDLILVPPAHARVLSYSLYYTMVLTTDFRLEGSRLKGSDS